MSDIDLINLIQAIEEKVIPSSNPILLVVSGVVLIGLIVSPEEYADRFLNIEPESEGDLWSMLKTGNELIGKISSPADASEYPNRFFCMANVSLVSGSRLLSLPLMRVSIDQVSAWCHYLPKAVENDSG